jgi:hypothetical protein
MYSLKRSLHTVLFIALPPLLGACAAYQTPGVSPVSSRLAEVTTTSGAVLVFDSLPAPQIVGDTVYGNQGGIRYAIPKSDVAATRWVAAPSEQTATRAVASGRRPVGGEPLALGPDAHVRITAPSLRWKSRDKDLAGVHGDTLLVRRTGGLLAFIPLPWGHLLSPIPVPSSAVTALEISQNHGRHTAAILLGQVVGGAAGAFAGYALRNRAPCDSGLAGFGCSFDRAFEGLGVTILGGAAGSLVGMLIANAAVPERWASVALPQTRASVVPLPGRRLGLGVSLGF